MHEGFSQPSNFQSAIAHLARAALSPKSQGHSFTFALATGLALVADYSIMAIVQGSIEPIFRASPGMKSAQLDGHSHMGCRGKSSKDFSASLKISIV